MKPAEILKLMIKYLGLKDRFNIVTTYTPKTPLETRLKVWNFWHLVSDESTITTCLARLRVSDKPGLQQDLEFAGTVKIVRKRNRQFYQSIWKTIDVPILALFKKYCEENPDHTVSKGTYMNLKPFYVRNVSLKDMEMCCCKLHLHIRWCITALVEVAKKLEINILFRDYKSFFQALYIYCDEAEDTYISWNCTPNKKTVCDHIQQQFGELTKYLASADNTITVLFTHFEKRESFDTSGEVIKNKKGEPVKRLVPLKEHVSAPYLVKFLSSLLSTIIHHRNMLKLYRNVKSLFIDTLNCGYLDIDFSENLTIGIKWEPQSLHWSKKQVTVHSGIVKVNEKKVYHPFISDTRTHDQDFVRIALDEMLAITDLSDSSMVVIESDNCSSQYKSIQHFHDLQEICNNINKPIIRIYGIAGHGKGEVDHVGGVAKVAVRHEIATGTVFSDSQEIVSFLQEKFASKECPSYNIIEIEEALLTEHRDASRRKVFKTIDGSSDFHLLVFHPNGTSFKAAPRLCVCNECKVSVGSCNLFKEYVIQVGDLNPIHLRSEVVPPTSVIGDEPTDDFIIPDTFVAVAPDIKSTDSVWFFKVTETNCVALDKVNDGTNEIPAGMVYIKGHFLEKIPEKSSEKSTLFKLSNKQSFIYKESVIYPFVNMQEGKKGYSLSNIDYTEILYYIEANGFSHI